MGDLAELQKMHDSEINARIEWFYDGVWAVSIGDIHNGFIAKEYVRTASDIVPTLQKLIKQRYPDSVYAKGLK